MNATLVQNGARLELSDHPYVTHPLAAMAIAEIYRYGFALCRVKQVTVTHRRESDSTLVVQVAWIGG